ncbi:O-antigen translocase, partial [Polaribacter sp.]|nr:O-antigen translocase [Polaribacter sp.]
MSEDKNSYRQIIKATSLFGGVQVFTILINIIRSKVVAILLGPSGMGVVGLLQATLSLVASSTNFGLRTSAVKDIAGAAGVNDTRKIAIIVTVLRRLVWGTGLLGAIIVFVLAPLLSKLTFGNSEYTVAFMWLSITLLINQLSSGQSVVLQGFRKLKLLAKSSVLGSFIGLLVTLPLYYIYGVKGIVPVIVLSSFITLLLTWYFSKKVIIEKINVDITQTIKEGKQMMTLGFMLSLSGLLTVAFSYIVRIFISNNGGIEDVGFYTAGFAVIGTYVGLVFSAMGTDFFPRLSSIAANNKKATLLINQQAEVAILVIAPILTVFLIFINEIITLLYSVKFIPINTMIYWAALGMYFKAASWAIGFILLAKGASKLFFWSELLANSYLLVLNIAGYSYWGLEGLGVSFLIGYVILLFQVFFIAKYYYNFRFYNAFYKIFAIQLALGICCFLVIRFIPKPWVYIAGLPFILSSLWYSYK